jgi:glycosyltransferase involved in cell wall biosynthesis
MVARHLVQAHVARGLDAHLVTSVDAWEPGDQVAPVLPVMRSSLSGSVRARVIGVAQGAILGHRPEVGRAYEGLQSVDHDVVVVHNIPEGIRAAPTGAFRVLYLHNDVLRFYSRRELRSLSAHVDLVVTVSAFLGERVPDALQAPRAVVLNGVDLGQFTPSTQQEGTEAPTVLFLGRVIGKKGVHILLAAASKLRHLPFTLRIVGSGSTGHRLSAYERNLRRRAHIYRLGDRVRFERSVPRSAIPALLTHSDILAVPSTWPDPCPLVMLEGLASGLPILGSRSGGIAELGANACLYHRPGAVDELAQQLEELLTKPTLRRSLGAAARARGEQLGWPVAERRLVEVTKGGGVR